MKIVFVLITSAQLWAMPIQDPIEELRATADIVTEDGLRDTAEPAEVTDENSLRLLKLTLDLLNYRSNKIKEDVTLVGAEKELALEAIQLQKKALLVAYDRAEEKGYLLGSIFIGAGAEVKTIPNFTFGGRRGVATVQGLAGYTVSLHFNPEGDGEQFFRSSFGYYVSGYNQFSAPSANRAQVNAGFAMIFQTRGTKAKFIGDTQRYFIGGGGEFPVGSMLGLQGTVGFAWNTDEAIAGIADLKPDYMSILVSVDFGKQPGGYSFPVVMRPILAGSYESDGVSKASLHIPWVKEFKDEQGQWQVPLIWKNILDGEGSMLNRKEQANKLSIEMIQGLTEELKGSAGKSE